MMKQMTSIIVAVIFTALLFSCTDLMSGNSSEITNGYCIAESGPVENAMVVAFPADFVPNASSAVPETTFTDTTGYFSVQLGSKSWNLLIYDATQTRGAFVPLPLGDSTLDTIILDRLGSITGIVNDTIADRRYAGIFGSPFYAPINGTTDTFTLTKLPPFYYSVNVWRVKISAAGSVTVPMNSNSVMTLSSSLIMVLPDSTTTLTFNP